MRGHSKPPNAEGHSQSIETEKQTKRGGVHGYSTRKRKERGNTGRGGGSSLVTHRRQATALFKKKTLSGGESDSEKHTT